MISGPSSSSSKYSSALDEWVHAASLDGWSSEECGDSVDGVGFWSFCDLLGLDRGEVKEKRSGGVLLTKDEQDFLLRQKAVIIKEDNYGFVEVTYYEGARSARAAWKEILEDDEAFREEAEEEEEEKGTFTGWENGAHRSPY